MSKGDEKREQRCETCRFANDFDESSSADPKDHTYQCRRYPPTLVHEFQLLGSDSDPCEGGWPLVEWNHWCGEWKPIGLPPEDQTELARSRAWRHERDWNAFRKCLSIRATKALDKLLIQDFAKLLATNPDDLMPHCGMTGLVDIARLLRAAGFGPLESGWPRDAT